MRTIKKADAVTDIDLINGYSLRELRPDEVFCFSAILCDNRPDRDNERFADAALYRMAELFPGKPGLIGHEWGGNSSSARVYRAGVEKLDGGALGLRADIFMPRIGALTDLIDKIETGIIKEVSVGVRMGKRTCSICGADMRWDECTQGHRQGDEYNGVKCLSVLDEPTDAFEFSFVSVPAQPGAGIIKTADDITPSEAMARLCRPDVELYADDPYVRAVIAKIKNDAPRAALLERNKKYIGGK